MPRNLRKRGTVYWYRIGAKGRTFEGSLETSQLRIAQERLEGIKRELSASRFGEKPRRTCGCRLLQEHGMALEKVSRWLGHADVRITQQRYAFLRSADLHRAIRPADVVALRTERAKPGTISSPPKKS